VKPLRPHAHRGAGQAGKSSRETASSSRDAELSAKLNGQCALLELAYRCDDLLPGMVSARHAALDSRLKIVGPVENNPVSGQRHNPLERLTLLDPRPGA
jgi:hypothetical protein